MTRKKTTEEFILESQKIHGNQYTYLETKYINAFTKVKIYCTKCRKFFFQTPNNHLSKKQGCPICGIKKNARHRCLTKKEFILRAKKIHGDNYNYSKVNYITSHDKVEIICNNCHKSFWQTPCHHIYGVQKTGCPYCKKSIGENRIEKLLRTYDIKFISQKRFKDCIDKKTLPFDFYLPDYNICIEYQGEQHYNPRFFIGKHNSQSNGKVAYQKQKLHDKIKMNYCKNNNIKLIEIKYNENIEEKLEKELNICNNN